MSYYPEQDSHVRDKVQLVLDLPNYSTKNNFNMIQALMYLI